MLLLWLTLILCFTGNIYNINFPSFDDGPTQRNNTEGGEGGENIIEKTEEDTPLSPSSSTINSTHVSFMGEVILDCKKWSCMNSQQNALCQCDKQCVLFGDCCMDAFDKLHLKPNNILTAVANPVSWFESNGPRTDMDAILLLFKYGKCIDYGSDIFRVIGDCPSYYDNLAIRTKCKGRGSNHLQNVPVTSKDVPMLNFNNKFCAYCHGVSSDQMIYWNISVTCPLALSVEGMTLAERFKVFESECKVGYDPPKSKSSVRKCLSEIHKKCSKEVSQNASLICNAYYAPYGSFANQHCAVCYNETEKQDECESERALKASDTSQGGLTMTNMFKIDLNSARTDKKSESLYICGSSKSQDLNNDKCTYPFCPDGFNKVSFRCEGATEKLGIEGLVPFQEEKYSIKDATLFIEIHTNTSEKILVDVSSVLLYIEGLMKQFLGGDGVKENVKFKLEHGENGIYEIELEINDVVSVTELLSWLQEIKKKIANDMREKGIVLNEIKIADAKHFEDLSCGEYELAIFQDVTLYQTKNKDFGFLIEQNKTISLSKTRYSVSMSLLADSFHGNWVAYCYAYINCSLVILDKTEFTLNDSRVHVNGLNEGIPPNQYIEMGDYLFVCEEALKLVFETESWFKNVINILTKATLSISVVCLMIFLILHMKYAKFRNLHGKSMMCFAVALIMAQFSIIMDVDSSSNVCVAIAILRHYVWLCVFVWCGIIAFDLAGRFCTRTMMSFGRANEVSRFKKYCIVAFGTPFSIVAICACINFLADGYLVGYGSNNLCWIGNSYALLASFFIPVLLIMITNIACLIVTVTGIEITKRATKNATKYKKDKSRVFMYIKVSFLLGITWIFVFLASSFNEPVLEIIQTLLNGLQGMFLLFSFLSNKRTINTIRKKTSTSSTPNGKTFSSIPTVSQTVSTTK